MNFKTLLLTMVFASSVVAVNAMDTTTTTTSSSDDSSSSSSSSLQMIGDLGIQDLPVFEIHFVIINDINSVNTTDLISTGR